MRFQPFFLISTQLLSYTVSPVPTPTVHFLHPTQPLYYATTSQSGASFVNAFNVRYTTRRCTERVVYLNCISGVHCNFRIPQTLVCNKYRTLIFVHLISLSSSSLSCSSLVARSQWKSIRYLRPTAVIHIHPSIQSEILDL